MVKRPTRIGNSLALVLDRSLLEAAKVDAETEPEISTDGDVIVLSPLRDSRRTAKLRAGVEKLNRRYARVLQRLAE